MTKNKSLHKFTYLELKKQVEAGEIISFKDFKSLNELDTKKAKKYLIDNLKDKDKTLNSFQLVISNNDRNSLWERNHRCILGTISNLMIEFNRMPTPNEIAFETKLSRQTILKHLKEFKTSSTYKVEQQQFELMRQRVLASLVILSMKGDVNACKVFLQATNPTSIKKPTPSNNNYIQINGLTINQTAIQNLTPEAIEQLTLVLAKANAIKP